MSIWERIHATVIAQHAAVTERLTELQPYLTEPARARLVAQLEDLDEQIDHMLHVLDTLSHESADVLA